MVPGRDALGRPSRARLERASGKAPEPLLWQPLAPRGSRAPRAGFHVRCSRQGPRLNSRADRGRSPAFAAVFETAWPARPRSWQPNL